MHGVLQRVMHTYTVSRESAVRLVESVRFGAGTEQSDEPRSQAALWCVFCYISYNLDMSILFGFDGRTVTGVTNFDVLRGWRGTAVNRNA